MCVFSKSFTPLLTVTGVASRVSKHVFMLADDTDQPEALQGIQPHIHLQKLGTFTMASILVEKSGLQHLATKPKLQSTSSPGSLAVFGELHNPYM